MVREMESMASSFEVEICVRYNRVHFREVRERRARIASQTVPPFHSLSKSFPEQSTTAVQESNKMG
jgi:hypothetical protein